MTRVTVWSIAGIAGWADEFAGAQTQYRDFIGSAVSLRGTSPPVGVFTRTPGGDWPQYIATGWEDSGAIHYNTGGLDFIDRNGNAELNWAGTLMTCARRPTL